MTHTEHPRDVLGVGYFVFEVADLAAWHTLLVSGLGLTDGGLLADGMRAYRLDERSARVLLREGSADDLVALGFEVDGEAALAAVEGRAREAGVAFERASEADAAARCVAALARVVEPGGVVLELFAGAVAASEPLDRSINAGGFVTGVLGAGHLALRADDIEHTRAFFERLLGFRLSDHIRCELRGGFQVDITFLHVNARHHSVALGRGLPKHLHHFMVQVAALDDLGRAYDRFFDLGLPVTQSLGRHPNDRMLSFYAKTPSGFEIECGYGGVEIDDATWTPTTYDQISLWGHRPPRSMKDLHARGRTDR